MYNAYENCAVSARQLATFCLLGLGWSQAGAASASGPDLLLYLKTAALPSSIRGEVKHQVETTMRDAGFHVGWFESRSGVPDTAADLVIVEFRGTCTPSSSAASDASGDFARLAYSAVADGKVLPFTWVDCGAVGRILSSRLASRSKPRQNRAYAVALARVLCHELYHVLGQTTSHTASGLTKARVLAEELTAERFEFDPEAIAHLRAGQVTPDALAKAGL